MGPDQRVLRTPFFKAKYLFIFAHESENRARDLYEPLGYEEQQEAVYEKDLS